MLLIEPQLLLLLKLKTGLLSNVGTSKRLNADFPLQAMNDFSESYFFLGNWFKREEH